MRYIILIIGIFVFSLSGYERWQGYTYPSLSGKTNKVELPFIFISTTGGSGGGFGKGDVHSHLCSVYFWDENIGVACGYGGVFKTKDGGLTWKRLKKRGGWYGVGMTGRDEIWLLEGFHGQPRANLYFSINGGKTWECTLKEDRLKGFADLCCKGNIIWVCGADFPSFYSLDKGKTWKKIYIWGSHKVSIPGDYESSPENFTIYILCDRRSRMVQKPYLKKSIDGGKTWVDLDLPEKDFGNLRNAYRWSMFFVDSRKGWLGLSDGVIAYTEDGGKNWERRDLPDKRDVIALWFDKLGRGFASVLNNNLRSLREALYYTEDGGKNWIPVVRGQKLIIGFFGLGPDKIWAVGTQPSLIPNDLLIFLKTTKERK